MRPWSATVLLVVAVVACTGAGRTRFEPVPSTASPATTATAATSLADPTETAATPSTRHVTPSPTPQASSIDSATAAISAERPPDAVGEHRGIRIELWLEDADAAIGERFFAHVRVSNQSGQRWTFEGNTCGGARASVVADAAASLRYDREWEGISGIFKDRLLAEAGTGRHAFRSLALIDEPEHACPAVSEPAVLRPGDTFEEDLAWDVRDPGIAGLPLEPGAGNVSAAFRFWAPRLDVSDDEEEVAVATTTISVVAPETGARTLGEYVDIALSNEEFVDWLEDPAYGEDTWINTHVSHWPNEEGVYPTDRMYTGVTAGTIGIGLFRNGPDYEAFGEVVIELGTERILGTRIED